MNNKTLTILLLSVFTIILVNNKKSLEYLYTLISYLIHFSGLETQVLCGRFVEHHLHQRKAAFLFESLVQLMAIIIKSRLCPQSRELMYSAGEFKSRVLIKALISCLHSISFNNAGY
jgi:hypothetical protein